MKTVVSTSRSADLLACHPNVLFENLKRTNKLKTHSVVIWTKNPENMIKVTPLKRELEKFDFCYVILTVTGLGGSIIEPNVPSYKEIFDILPKVIDFLKNPERVAIRYDPLIILETKDGKTLTNVDENLFLEIAERASNLGIRRIITSIVTPYQKVQDHRRGY